MKLSETQLQLLKALLGGWTLKSHRYLDGSKLHKLHALDGTEKSVRWGTVEALKKHGLIDSNKKFPAATYLLTEKGQEIAAEMMNDE